MPKSKSRPKNKRNHRTNRPDRRTGALWKLNPGGDLYSEWVEVPQEAHPDCWAANIAADPQMEHDEKELARRFTYFAKTYGSCFPYLAACLLEDCVEDGQFILLKDEDPSLCKTLAVEEFAPAAAKEGLTAGDLLHRMHARGLILVESEGVIAMATPWYLNDRARRVAAGELG